MPSYLYAVQDDQGREVVSAHVDVEKVSDVTASFDPVEEFGWQVDLGFENLTIETSGVITSKEKPVGYQLCRWPSDDKLATPVCHPVK